MKRGIDIYLRSVVKRLSANYGTDNEASGKRGLECAMERERVARK